MSRPVNVMPATSVVEAAINTGRIPESRRAHYLALMAKRPRKTARLLASLEPCLPTPEDKAILDGFDAEGYEAAASQAAPAGSRAADGPTAYPKDWLGHGQDQGAPGVLGGAPSGHDPITFETPELGRQAATVVPQGEPQR